MTTRSLTGAESLVAAAGACGIEVCFANPGTSEVRIVGALDRVGGIRAVLGLFEGVVTGAADGYARIAGKPAMTLLHLGPGLANGLANLHNARRARTPVVNVVGEHAIWHLPYDSPITSDIGALAGAVSRWVHTISAGDDVSRDMAAAVSAAVGPPSGVATLLVPMDVQWQTTDHNELAPVAPVHRDVEDQQVAACAAALAEPGAVLLLGGNALVERGLVATARIAEATGCRVFTDTFPARVERGGGLPWFRTLPYFPEQAQAALDGAPVAVLAGSAKPAYMFGDPSGVSSPLPDVAQVVALADLDQDVVGALEHLAEHIGAMERPSIELRAPGPTRGPLDPRSIGAVVAAALPRDAVVVDEAGTSAYGYTIASPGAERHVALGLTGGAIGMGLPVAIGAAVAGPSSRVVALQADGSAMYTVQALWTLAREHLDVTVVLYANARYGVLGTELERAGHTDLGPTAASLIDLSDPTIDWVSLAGSLGVPAARVHTSEELARALARSFETPGPMLIEAPC